MAHPSQSHGRSTPAGRPEPLGLKELAASLVRAVRPFLVEKPGQILLSAIVLLMLWGTHGRLELLRLVLPAWRGPGSDPLARPGIIPGIPWDHELVSFGSGALLLVVIPILIIKLGFRERLADYGLALPQPGRRWTAAWVAALLFLVCLPAFFGFARSPDFQAVYPFFRDFTGWRQLALYELSYLPFFVAIEFIFRGYLLFGLAGTPVGHGSEIAGHRGLPGYALLLQMLPYTAWHLGKPLPELWGTLFWGLVAGGAAWALRSIWPIVAAHWLLNVFMDGWIWAVELGGRP